MRHEFRPSPRRGGRALVSASGVKILLPGIVAIAVVGIGVAAAQYARQRPGGNTSGTAGAASANAVSMTQPVSDWSAPAGISDNRPLPREYAILLERSIFTNHVARPPSPFRGTGGPVSASEAARSAAEQAAAAQEAALAFRGAMLEGGKLIAFVEDTSAGKTYRLKTGDPLGRGRMGVITLEYMVYQVGDKQTRVEIGHTLTGTGIAPATTRPSGAGLPTASSSNSSPSSASSSSSTPPGGNDVLEKMRQRRLQEGGR